MLKITKKALLLSGPAGQLAAPPDDPILPKLIMLYQGECGGLGPQAAALRFGFSKQRYFQLRRAFAQGGTLALQNQKRGPKTHYRRTHQVLQQVVRYRFLDPDASAQVIGQKLRQTGYPISTRSVERVLAQFGLQKKTPPLPTHSLPRGNPGPPQQALPTTPTRRPRKSGARRSSKAGR